MWSKFVVNVAQYQFVNAVKILRIFFYFYFLSLNCSFLNLNFIDNNFFTQHQKVGHAFKWNIASVKMHLIVKILNLCVLFGLPLNFKKQKFFKNC